MSGPFAYVAFGLNALSWNIFEKKKRPRQPTQYMPHIFDKCIRLTELREPNRKKKLLNNMSMVGAGIQMQNPTKESDPFWHMNAIL